MEMYAIKAIFGEALGFVEGPERAAYLDRACRGDSALRSRIDEMLANHARIGAFLASNGGQTAGTRVVNAELMQSPSRVLFELAQRLGGLPRVLLAETETEAGARPLVRPRSHEMPALVDQQGRYQLLGEIARGGMGAILKGRDADLGRDLAIKVLLDEHRDDVDMVRRFVEEAQIGGQLQHPGIVPVYEMGVFSDQRPFFAMKLVNGRTLAGLLESRPNPPHDRPRFVAIFEQICETMAYAHARGVIHRDLKPSNVMVGGFGEVQVMDWGLAKVLAAGGAADDARGLINRDPLVRTSRSGSLEGASQAGSVMGTPAYMPPEQARGEVSTLDERADVFALGATLCEILTGKPPYVASTSLELRRQAAVAELDDAMARLSACGADAELVGLARRCLSPTPAGRPRDAGEVARAVTAYLAGVQERLRGAELQRVEAQARAAEERKRRRAERAMAAGLFVLLSAGIAGVASQWRRAETNLAAADSANRELGLSLNREVHARDDAQARFRLAQAAIERFYTGASEDVLLKEPQLKALRDKLLGSALEFYKQLQSVLDTGGGEAPRSELAAAYQRVGEITEQIGSLPSALEAHERALAIRERLTREHPEDLGYWKMFARSFRLTGQCLDNLARPSEALSMYHRELEIRARLAREHPEIREAQESEMATAQAEIGLIMSKLGSGTEALEWSRRALASSEQLANAHPDVVKYQEDAARSHFSLGAQLETKGRSAEAIGEFRMSAGGYERLVSGHPDALKYRRGLALARSACAIALTQAGRPQEALKEFERVTTVQERVVRDQPNNSTYKRELALTHAGAADLLARIERPAEALAAARRALEIQVELAGANPAVVLYKTDVALTHVIAGQQLATLGRVTEAKADLRHAAALYEGLVEPSPSELLNLACCYAQLCGLVDADPLSASSSVPAVADSFGDRAIATLRRAIAAGHANIRAFAEDPSLGPIRARTDFRALMMDLAFPIDPFVH